MLDSLMRFATSRSNMKYHALLGLQGLRQVRTWVWIYFRVGPFFEMLWDPSWDLYIEYSNEPTFYLFFQSYTYEIYSCFRLTVPLLGQSLPVRVVGHKICAHHKLESVFLSVCGSKYKTIGFHSLILG